MVFRHPAVSEREAILDLIAAAFPNPRARQRAVRDAVASDPDYEDARTIVCAAAGRLVGHVACCATDLALGGAWLPVARLGTVCTLPEARRRGIGRRLVMAAAALEPRAGAVILDPAPEPYVRRFYETLGFVAAPRCRPMRRLAAEQLPTGAARGAVRDAVAADVPRLAALYEQHYGPQPGHVRRRAAWWESRVARRPLLWSELLPTVRVLERDGQPVAYVVASDDDDLRIWECVGSAEDAGALVADEARRAGPRFNAHVTRHDSLWPAVLGWSNGDAPAQATSLMVRVQSVPAAQAALAAQLAPYGASVARAALTWHNDRGVIGRAGATLTAKWSHLLALALDGRCLEEWVSAGSVTIQPASALAAMVDLFPVREAGRRLTDAY
jgi:predicted N-acetyltransferase YhbS